MVRGVAIIILVVGLLPAALDELVIQTTILWTVWCRVSLMATAILWLPLLYVAHDTVGGPVSHRLRYIVREPFPKFLRGVGLVTVLGITSVVGMKVW